MAKLFINILNKSASDDHGSTAAVISGDSERVK